MHRICRRGFLALLTCISLPVRKVIGQQSIPTNPPLAPPLPSVAVAKPLPKRLPPYPTTSARYANSAAEGALDYIPPTAPDASADVATIKLDLVVGDLLEIIQAKTSAFRYNQVVQTASSLKGFAKYELLKSTLKDLL
jgi:hypothetical protein